MESKKINQLATELTPALSDITIIGDPSTGISKKITLSQMASLFTGTVEEYANLAAFPLVGVADTIYIALDTNVLYRWNTGTNAYVELSPNIISNLVFGDANGFDGNISLVGSTATLTITTALTTGSVPFIGASGALSQDNANLFFDDTNNRLGINTNAPTTALDAFGSGIIGRLNGTSTNNAFLGFASAGTNKWSIGNVQSDHRFRIYSEPNSTELISVLQTGEFGIGIANPLTKLHIFGGATALIANLDANVSVAKSISFRSGNSSRINLEVSGTESGSNAGADLFVRRYSDAGALINTPLTITRSTGMITTVGSTMSLQVNGGTLTTNDASTYSLGIGNGGGRDLALGTNTTSGVIQTFSAKILALNPLGNNVAINKTTASYALDVEGSGYFSNRLSIGSTISNWGSSWRPLQMGSYGSFISGRTDDNSMFIGKNVFFDGTNWIGTTTGWAQQMFFDSSGNTIFRSINATANTATGFTESLRIQSDGIIKLSTTTTITSDNNTILSYSPNGYLYIQGGSTGLALAGSGNRNNAIYVNSSSNQIQFHTGDGTLKAMITSGGNVLIGTTTDNGSKLQVNGAIYANAYRINDTGGGFVTLGMQDASRWSINYLARFSGYGAGTLTTDASGNITASSDSTLKNIIKPVENVLNKIMDFEPVYFKWNEKTDLDKENIYISTIAQSIEKNFPEAVGKMADGTLTVQDRAVTAILVKAIQELKAEIDILKAK